MMPKYVSKYFWGDDLRELSFKKHKNYIAKVILERGDKQSVGWLLKRINLSSLRKELSALGLTPKSANFWKLVLKK